MEKELNLNRIKNLKDAEEEFNGKDATEDIKKEKNIEISQIDKSFEKGSNEAKVTTFKDKLEKLFDMPFVVENLKNDKKTYYFSPERWKETEGYSIDIKSIGTEWEDEYIKIMKEIIDSSTKRDNQDNREE